jgi:hypothetical protein
MQLFGRRLPRRALFVVLFALLSARAQSQSCPHPQYPSLSPAPIDSTSCGPAGSGGAETAQNEAKNNFCASGSAGPMTISQMIALQQQAQKDKNLPFGNPHMHPLTTTHGPATDRTALATLGEGSVVVLSGFVKIARPEGAESVNCGKGKGVPDQADYHDIHISIVESPDQEECSGVVVEMIPHHRPTSWNSGLVSQVASAKLPVRITGQLMFDSSHTPCVDGKGVSGDPSRASLWEVHPIYKFEVCTQSDCSSGHGWVPLEAWKTP